MVALNSYSSSMYEGKEITRTVIRSIPVRVNPKDYSQYMVDVEAMEKRIVDYT